MSNKFSLRQQLFAQGFFLHVPLRLFLEFAAVLLLKVLLLSLGVDRLHSLELLPLHLPQLLARQSFAISGHWLAYKRYCNL